MKEYNAHFISNNVTPLNLGELSKQLEQFEKQNIAHLAWSSDTNCPAVSFIAAHTNSSLLLKYTVKEKYIRATYHNANDTVYKDSCVEAFIAFDDTGYYNLEFNCIGTALIGYGIGKEDRVNVNSRLIKSIDAHSLIKTPIDDILFYWELTLNIPFGVFEYHTLASLTAWFAKLIFINAVMSCLRFII